VGVGDHGAGNVGHIILSSSAVIFKSAVASQKTEETMRMGVSPIILRELAQVVMRSQTRKQSSMVSTKCRLCANLNTRITRVVNISL
jgi:hypothetical protein